MVRPVSIGSFYPAASSSQTPATVAVAIPTILRPCVVDAVRSVYRQEFDGTIQILIGVDIAKGDIEMLNAVLEERPAHVTALVLALPYSTSKRHGGVHEARDGGAIRATLSLLANSRLVATLDDDNTWESNHLAVLERAIAGRTWAATQRYLVDEDTGERLCVDRWDSVGVNRGRFASQGGLVDTNCIMVDKIKAAAAFHRWSANPQGMGADRNFFRAIAGGSHAYVPVPTVNYRIRRTNILWQFMRENVSFPPVMLGRPIPRRRPEALK
jgi:hypothetical protein